MYPLALQLAASVERLVAADFDELDSVETAREYSERGHDLFDAYEAFLSALPAVPGEGTEARNG